MKPLIITFLSFVFSLVSVQGQTAFDLNSGLTMVDGPGQGELIVQWWGINGHGYALETSTDLENWTFINQAYEGQGGIIAGVGTTLQNGGDRVFWRIRRSPTPLLQPLAWDADEDGVGLQDELALGTNPFSSTDSDFDDLPDDWEEFRFGDLTYSDLEDWDLDGLSNAQEWIQGTDPLTPEPLSEPVFALLPGSYTEPQSIEIQNPNAVGEIRYTLDGSEPTVYSPLYIGPILIENGSLTIKARVLNSFRRSLVSDAVYSISYSSDPAAPVFFGIVYEDFLFKDRYTHNSNDLDGTKYLSLGNGWINQDGSKFYPDYSTRNTPQQVYKVAGLQTISGLSVPLEGYTYSAGASTYSSSEKFELTSGWILDHDRLESDFTYNGVASAEVYIGIASYFGLSKPVMSTNGSQFTQKFRIGKGWINVTEFDEFLETASAPEEQLFSETFVPDMSAPDAPVYLGSIMVSGVPFVGLSYDASSFPSSYRHLVGTGKITTGLFATAESSGIENQLNMIPNTPNTLVSNVVFGAKNFHQSGGLYPQYIIGDSATSNFSTSTINLGAGYISSFDRFFPAVTTAKNMWSGARLSNGILFPVITYNQSDINFGQALFIGKGWIYADGPQLLYLLESEANLDADDDGLTNYEEIFTYRTYPDNWDSDGDLLSDNVEVSNPALDPWEYVSPREDLDGDGLANLEEFLLGSDPSLEDGDNDTFSDVIEAHFGTDPSSPTDNPGASSYDPRDVIEVELTIGDWSGSHSERYSMQIVDDATGNLAASAEAPDFGEVYTTTSRRIRAGRVYTITVNHVATNIPPPGLPDYDYLAEVNFSSSINPFNAFFIIDDQTSATNLPLLGEHGESSEDYADGKIAKLVGVNIVSVFETDHADNKVPNPKNIVVPTFSSAGEVYVNAQDPFATRSWLYLSTETTGKVEITVELDAVPIVQPPLANYDLLVGLMTTTDKQVLPEFAEINSSGVANLAATPLDGLQFQSFIPGNTYSLIIGPDTNSDGSLDPGEYAETGIRLVVVPDDEYGAQASYLAFLAFTAGQDVPGGQYRPVASRILNKFLTPSSNFDGVDSIGATTINVKNGGVTHIAGANYVGGVASIPVYRFADGHFISERIKLTGDDIPVMTIAGPNGGAGIGALIYQTWINNEELIKQTFISDPALQTKTYEFSPGSQLMPFIGANTSGNNPDDLFAAFGKGTFTNPEITITAERDSQNADIINMSEVSVSGVMVDIIDYDHTRGIGSPTNIVDDLSRRAATLQIGWNGDTRVSGKIYQIEVSVEVAYDSSSTVPVINNMNQEWPLNLQE